MASDPTTPPDASASLWKDRYRLLRSRLVETKAALRAARERELEARETLMKVRERLHARERAVLRPEVVAALMPARAAWRRHMPRDETVERREAAHLLASAGYAAACRQDAPVADRVEIGGVSWFVPLDARVEGRLADRIVRGRHLPFVDIIRTREALSNGTMLDIGANIGLTSVLRVVLGDAPVVYAAEPAPDNFACLVRTVIENGLRGLVLPDCVAISDHDGTSALQMSQSLGGHAIVPGAEGIDVTTVRLDTWVKKLGIEVESIQFVKIDTQGHEAHVLAGAPDLLGRAGVAWELEFSPRHLQTAGRGTADLIAQMQAAFTHFIDLSPDAPGRRIRRIEELPEAVAYLDQSFTDLLAYRAATNVS